jgi:hypothetical protein
VLSVAHAAEVYCNLLLSEFDPTHPAKENYYPALEKATAKLLALDKAKDRKCLTDSERFVIGEILPKLVRLRGTLMHEPAPEEIPATDTAMALLSLLNIIRRRFESDATETFGQDEIQRDIFDEIDWRNYDAWSRAAEKLALSEYGYEHLESCSECGALAVIPDRGCQACFHAP